MKKNPHDRLQHAGKSARRWSARGIARSDAMNFQRGLSPSNDPRRIGWSVNRSSDRIHRRTANPGRPAVPPILSIHNEKRAGSNPGPARRLTLEEARAELKKIFGRSGYKLGKRKPKA